MKPSKEHHFAVLSETSAAVRPIVDNWANSTMSESLRAAISPSMERCLSRRRVGPLLRPLLARMSYEMTGGTDWRDQLPILAAVELLNISTYQSNYCFDEKAGVTTTKDRNNQFICSMLTISRAMSLVESCHSFRGDAKSRIVSLVARSNDEVYQIGRAHV